ncbi:MAG: DNA topoisomerase IB [Planctomycetota bacterium]
MAETPRQLIYVNDQMPGIRRRRCGRGFTYLDDMDQKRIEDQAVRQRIDALAIPPAYEDVWICRLADGHLQATGRDAAGRKQYRYHAEWSAYRNARKFDGLVNFAQALPKLRRQVQRDLDQPTLSKPRVIAAGVRLMDLTLVRPGHGGETEGKPTYGLATLRNKHVLVDGEDVVLQFRGKSGQPQERSIASGAVAKVLRRCLGLPGQELFQYVSDDVEVVSIDAGDINSYIKNITAIDSTAKDFRTSGATVIAAAQLAQLGFSPKQATRDKRVVEAIKRTAQAIGNRPATCRKYYVAPAIIQSYHDGKLRKQMNDRPCPDRPSPRQRLSAEEKAVLKILVAEKPKIRG